VTFLPTRVDLWYDSKWNNVTASVLTESGIRIERGWSGETDSGVDPSTCELVFKSTDGTFSPNNPESSLYGKIGRNTPVRVGCGAPAIAATATGAGGTDLTAPSVTAEATGAQIVFAYARPVGNFSTPATFTAGTERDGDLSTGNSFRKTSVAAGATGTVTVTFSTTLTGWVATNVHVPGVSSLSVISSGNFADGDNINLNTSSFTGDYVLLCLAWSSDVYDRMIPAEVDTDFGRGWTLISDSGVSADDTSPRMMVWGMPLNGDQDDFYAFGALDGAQDAYFCFVNCVGAADWSSRFTGFISEWPQRWDHAEALVTVPVQAAGVTRRLSQNTNTLSPVHAANLTRFFLEYWPLEDGRGATEFANVLGGESMVFSGSPILSTEEIQGSLPLPTFTAAGAQAPVRAYDTSLNEHAVVALFRCPLSGTAAGANIVQMQFAGGTLASLHVEYTSATVYTLKVAFNDGTATAASALSTLNASSHGRVYLVIVAAHDLGAGPIVSAVMIPVDTDYNELANLASFSSAALAGESIGRCSRITVGIEGGTGATLNTNAPTMGHVGFIAQEYGRTTIGASGDEYTYSAQSLRAFWGWARELTSIRLTRLARAEGVKLQGTYQAEEHEAAVEPTAPLLERLTSAANAVPGSQLYEASGFAGYVFRHPRYLEAAPRVEVPYTSCDASLEPTDDDRALVNAASVESPSGASARYVNTESVADVGLYEKKLELGLQESSATRDAASWAVALGTAEGVRWPLVRFDLRTQASLRDDTYLWLDIGDRVDFAGVPAFAGADTQLIVRGMREEILPHAHYVTLVCAPGEPWNVAYADGDFFVGDDGDVTVSEDLTTTETDASLSGTLADPPTGPDAYDVVIAGERATVTDVTAGVATLTRSVNGVVKAQANGATVRVVAGIVGM
jgi:hypothetical protein